MSVWERVPETCPQPSTAGTGRRGGEGRTNCCCCENLSPTHPFCTCYILFWLPCTCWGCWGEVSVDCYIAGHVPHLNCYHNDFANEDFEDEDDISIEDFEDDNDSEDFDDISNPKACNEVKNSHFASHAAHLGKEASASTSYFKRGSRGRSEEGGVKGIFSFEEGVGLNWNLLYTCSWRRTR